MSTTATGIIFWAALELKDLLCYSSDMKTVLIVDDDEVIRLELARALRDADFEVALAADGAEGLATAESLKPDLIVLDQDMPKLYGEEVLIAIRATAWGKDLPVIAFTISEDVDVLNQNLQAGVTEYFDKSSVAPEQVVEIIKEKLQ